MKAGKKGQPHYHICRLCDRSIIELKETQVGHLEKHHGLPDLAHNRVSRYFRAPFAIEIVAQV